jgi:hypothetical protein
VGIYVWLEKNFQITIVSYSLSLGFFSNESNTFFFLSLLGLYSYNAVFFSKVNPFKQTNNTTQLLFKKNCLPSKSRFLMHTTLTSDITMYNQCFFSEDCSTSSIVLYVYYINPSRSARKSLIESLEWDNTSFRENIIVGNVSFAEWSCSLEQQSSDFPKRKLRKF